MNQRRKKGRREKLTEKLSSVRIVERWIQRIKKELPKKQKTKKR